MNRIWPLALLALLVAGCAGVGPRDGGPDRPMDFSEVPDAVPKHERRTRAGNPPSYVVNGRRYHLLDSPEGYIERGIASWYGTKFHGRKTSLGERYDMYAMTAAHKTLPIPSYVRVRNLRNGHEVVVRVNDRGPFHDNRIIDLSYAAASKLGIAQTGTGLVEVKTVTPGSERRRRQNAAVQAEAPKREAAGKPESEQPGPAKAVKTAASPPQTERAGKPEVPPASAPSTPPPRRGDEADAAETEADTAPDLFLQVGAFAELDNAERLRSRLRRHDIETVRIQPARREPAPVYRVRVGPLPDVEQADLLAKRLTKLGMGPPHVVIE